MQKTLSRRVQEDEEDDFVNPPRLGFFVNSFSVNQYTVPLDEAVVNPAYYRDIVNMLYGAGEHDTVVFTINSPGGRLDGLLSLLDAIASTNAKTIASLTGSAHSAASILALHCDMLDVGPYSTMLCHNVSYGYSGKGSDVLSHVQHVSKTSEKLFRDTYKDFLTEEEIAEVLAGKELYLDAEEIEERAANREAIRIAEFEASQNPTPAKKTRKKVKDEA